MLEGDERSQHGAPTARRVRIILDLQSCVTSLAGKIFLWLDIELCILYFDSRAVMLCSPMIASQSPEADLTRASSR